MTRIPRKKNDNDIQKISQICLQIFGTNDEETKTVFIEAFSELFDEMKRIKKTFPKLQLCRKQRIQILRKTWDILEDYKESFSTISWINASKFFHDHYNRMNYIL
jgi:hypothetical protein